VVAVTTAPGCAGLVPLEALDSQVPLPRHREYRAEPNQTREARRPRPQLFDRQVRLSLRCPRRLLPLSDRHVSDISCSTAPGGNVNEVATNVDGTAVA
jgi:hypothetical protein